MDFEPSNTVSLNVNPFTQLPGRIRSGLSIAGYVVSGTQGNIKFTDDSGNLIDVRVVRHVSGPDGALFEFDSEAKSLRFKSPPDYNNPSDKLASESNEEIGTRVYSQASDNDYLVTLVSSRGGKTVAVRVVQSVWDLPTTPQDEYNPEDTSFSGGFQPPAPTPAPGPSPVPAPTPAPAPTTDSKTGRNNSGVVATLTGGELGAGDGVLTITKGGVSKAVVLPQTGPDESPIVKELGLVGYYAYEPAVAVGKDRILLVYSGERAGVGGGNYGQFYNFNAEPIGGELWLTSQTNQGHRPGVAAFSDGRFLTLWQTNNPVGYPEIADRVGYVVGRVVLPDGSLEETFVIATNVNLLETAPKVTFKNGKVSVSWTEYSSVYDLSASSFRDAGEINQLISGSDSADEIFGLGGDDSISGLNGNDTLDGGADDDTVKAGGGNDTVMGGQGDDSLGGDAGNDTLLGGDGNDSVSAGSGNDLIIGGDGAGDDNYDGGAGVDTVKYTSALDGITVNLTRGTATSTAGNDAAGIGTDRLKGLENIVSGDFDDTLIGSSVANSITGEAGNDTIDGGLGMDTLVGGSGADTFVFSTKIGNSNVDTITDFESGIDRIQLSRKVFTKLTIGSLDAGSFVSGSGAVKALDANDFLIFNGSQLLYDADGSGKGAAVVIANIVGIQASDILIVA